MKSCCKLIIVCLCLVVGIFVYAEECSLPHSNEALAKLTNQIERLEVENQLLSDSIKRQTDKINELVAGLNDVRRKLDSKSKDIKKLPLEGGPYPPIGLVALWILLPIVLLLLLVGGYLFWPHHETGQTLASQSKSGLPKCPCCGWEHDPSESVCRNPRCKTHF